MMVINEKKKDGKPRDRTNFDCSLRGLDSIRSLMQDVNLKAQAARKSLQRESSTSIFGALKGIYVTDRSKRDLISMIFYSQHSVLA